MRRDTDARKALYVPGSDRCRGMGAAEAVPFSDRTQAETFVSDHGGHIVGLAEVPDDYVLGSSMSSHPMPQQ